MPRIIRYLSHPQVRIDPVVPIPHWPLDAVGAARVAALAASGALKGTRHVFTSDEVKAVQTAGPLAKSLGCVAKLRPNLHENDRSATGFLPPEEFEATADRFFSNPDKSIRGWETARAAQARIVAAVTACLAEAPSGDVLIVGHGGVGTLLYCHLAGVHIDRRHDQRLGGGCYFAFESLTSAPQQGWQPMERLIA